MNVIKTFRLTNFLPPHSFWAFEKFGLYDTFKVNFIFQQFCQTFLICILFQANIRLCGLTREPWWAGFYSWADYLDCILYIATYLTTSILFILGIRAPGDYLNCILYIATYLTTSILYILGLRAPGDYLDCILYIATYLTTSILFILGIRAPGD